MCEGLRCEGEGHGHRQEHVTHGKCYRGCGHSGRRFLSRKDQIEMLEEYRESLQNELKGVEEKLNALMREP